MKSLKKVLAILISAVLMVTAMSVCAFADQYSDAKALNNKKTVSESIKRDVTNLMEKFLLTGLLRWSGLKSEL